MKKCSLKELAKKGCVPCEGGVPRLKGTALKDFQAGLGHGWKVVKGHQLEKEFKFKDFKSALAFTNRLGKLAEKENHHPDIALAWGKVGVSLWTHAIGGLSENDFVLAAKIENLGAGSGHGN
jgi:4a-hydroxytetrahydrobiopterin dehydratase